ncbi:hypothetical protein [Actinoalloteichus sp. GBA129-24]|uniref:hypothetical protein n=1 Tax=Actinoalloteichus sp. GBA129-24 TaxID=1612551 RepID=UPI000950B151|nr:hypothetical protein [Actinoalloteichus sp. GBA129-24]APU20138.1 hypothetical protein UA75_10625 [Actinoalloteichus sp. GBA129-24]
MSFTEATHSAQLAAADVARAAAAGGRRFTPNEALSTIITCVELISAVERTVDALERHARDHVTDDTTPDAAREEWQRLLSALQAAHLPLSRSFTQLAAAETPAYSLADIARRKRRTL